MDEQKPTSPDAESRLLAALAHASIIAQGLGLLVGVVIYLTQREKSRYAAFQALQAAMYQLGALVVTVGLWLAWGILYGLSMIPIIRLAEAAPDAPPPPIFWIGLASIVVPIAAMLAFGLYGLWGGLCAWRGRDFRYKLVGRWLERSGLVAAADQASPPA